MNAKAVAIIVILLFLGGGAVAAGDASASQSSSEITGISVGPVTDDVEYGANITEIEQALETLGYTPPEEATWITTEDDTKHLVFSEEPIPAGKATVSGQQISIPGVDQSIVFADDFEVQRTGEAVAFSEFESNTSAYAYEVIELESKVRVGSVAAKPDGSSAVKLSVATFDPPGSTVGPSIDIAPGQYARQAAINLSEHDLESLTEVDTVLGIGEFKGAAFDHQFWGSGEANATVAVIPKYQDRPFQEPELVGYDLVLVDVDYDSTELEDPGELADDAGEYDGEMVTLETDVVGTTTSPQEFLTTTVSCGGRTIWVPGTSVCVPLVVDSVVHSGVAVSVDDGVSMVPYAGLSNEIQHNITEWETGRYELTGEVVAASEIAPGVDDGAGLLVHDMERVGDATLDEEVESQAESKVGELEDSIRTQINTSQADWNDGDSGADGPGDDGGDEDDGETGNESDGEDGGETGTGDDAGDDGDSDDGTGGEGGSGDQDDGEAGDGDEDETGDEDGGESGDEDETGDEDGETGGEDESETGDEDDGSDRNESDGVIRPEACLEDGEPIAEEGFVVENGSIDDANLTIGENTTVTLSVVSCHREAATVSVSLQRNGGTTGASTTVELAPAETRAVTLAYEPTSAGTYELAANGTATEGLHAVGTVEVSDAPSDDSDGSDGDDADERSSAGEGSANESDDTSQSGADSSGGDESESGDQDATDDGDGDSTDEGGSDSADDDDGDASDGNSSDDGDGEPADSQDESNGGDETASGDEGDSSDAAADGSDGPDPSSDGEQAMPGFGVVPWLVSAAVLASLAAARRSRRGR